ncbi:bacteriohemerythrin [Denitratisoma oestradiolicum]|uniref:Methyl-accepting chemotaxis sensory transducer n=1 Tax=Denitratisoma oestradiolicum TaxID=311182 RepID=A0A6S6XYR7_9PROT|nr:bacteriohemerythrin [Denitratisoma oestradiolicum]CAB1370188.1 Methyl-accepting chemotaxis sensory transducer [Denitratisoma oestradiolicum]
MEWDNSLTTGLPVLDAQHQAIFRCFEQLRDASAQRRMLRVAHALTQLETYVREHFADEEKVLAAQGFPGLKEHAAEHRQFAGQLVLFRRRFLARDISEELSQFLADWLENHVRIADMEYVRFLSVLKDGKEMGDYQAKASPA